MAAAAVMINNHIGSPLSTITFSELFPFITQIIFGALFLCISIVYWMLYFRTSPCVFQRRTDDEKQFMDENGQQKLFPSLKDECTLDLSVIVPAYNEQDRIRPMLESCLHFLTDVSRKSTFEVIVVSDGSVDGTCDIVMEYVQQYGSDRIRLLKLQENRGKGGAVCLGMQSARGRTLLFADADGATKFEDLDKLETVLHYLAPSNNKI